jgi:3-hydroxymyristoyl/3-hydroxydecanoyl-(acyl carrier protein) dehydratase
MAERFSAFSFVDRIIRCEPGVRAAGRYAIPPAVAQFPPSLVAEAVGQLAAWTSMSQLAFRRRPVAGLAGEALFLADVMPGQTLDLEVEIQRCDEDAVAYGGAASVDGVLVLQLRNCLGPMLPMEEFDAPEAVRADFETLRGAGAPPGRFKGIAAREVNVVERAPGERLRAELRVPESAPFFGDHFPRRPVFPATLLLHAQTALALELARGAEAWRAGRELALARVRDVKMRAWILPGQRVELRADLAAPDADAATVKLAARVDRATVATGRAEIVPARAAALAAARSA